MNFEGIMTALVTPMDLDNKINEESFRNLIRFQVNNNVHSLLILGGTGEYLALSTQERKRAVKIAVEEAGSDTPIIVGLIAPGIRDTIEMGISAKELGATAIMPVTPYYVNPTQTGIVNYYEQLDKEVDLPIILYNIPHKTTVHMEAETVEKIVDNIPNVKGIKECALGIGQITDLINRVGNKIAVLAGEEYLAVSAMIMGAKGAVMASANIIPHVWRHIWELIQDKEYETALEMNLKYFPLFKTIFAEPNPGPLKEILNICNLPVGQASVPLGTPNEQTITLLKELTQKYDLSQSELV